ncbi:MAG: Mov34/MPN/PAD-1 family protein [Thermoplasmatales archaeon]|nr:MAG: Mov34/MPN/PAD-1 family protein [Thermoplasmatales archaeon]
MSIFKKKKISENQVQWKIKRGTLDFILESAKSTYPNEFGGLLRIDSDEKDTILEIIILPGTISGDSHAIFKLHMLPIDFSIVGTVHSHPSFSFHPSDADLLLFRRFGKVHIVVAYPFTYNSWKSYNHFGIEINMEVV